MLVTFAVSIDDTPGVLNRVAALLHRRAVDIASLAVGPTERAGVSRMTIVVDTDVAGSRRRALWPRVSHRTGFAQQDPRYLAHHPAVSWDRRFFTSGDVQFRSHQRCLDSRG